MFKSFLTRYYAEEKGYLTSQFTFGFELEGFVFGGAHNLYDFQDWAEDYFRSHKKRGVDFDNDESIDPHILSSNANKCPECNGAGKIGKIKCSRCNGSGMLNPYHEDPLTFEMKSPVFSCTPADYQIAITFLKEAKHRWVKTNSSCSLHTHIGFPDAKTRSEDIFWILCQLSTNKYEEVRDKLQKFEDISFISAAFADVEIFKNVKNAINNYATTGSTRAIEQVFWTDKFQILNQHHQGTLEWRGPRNFLQQDDDGYITRFFKHLNSILIDFSNMLNDTKVIISKTKTIDKSDLYKTLSNINPPAGRIRTHSSDKFNMRQDSKLLPEIFEKFSWLKKAQFKNALMDITADDELWVQLATWNDGDFNSGMFNNGFFNGGRFVNGRIESTTFNADKAVWVDGEWSGGDNKIVYKGKVYATNKNPNDFIASMDKKYRT